MCIVVQSWGRQDKCSPIPADMREGGKFSGVFFGIMIGRKLEDPCQEFWRKAVSWIPLVQKVRNASRRRVNTAQNP